jgi:hypothetical protein
MKGYIKDYRQEIKSDIWLMPPMYHRVWQWLKYMVNHEDNEIPMRDGSRFLIKKGQHMTSLRDIAQGVGWYEGAKWKEPNPKTISVILEWLVKQEMILIDKGKGNRQYTLVTLLNWDLYQVKNDKGNSKETVDGTDDTQPLDINKNDKNEKNEEEINKSSKSKKHNFEPVHLELAEYLLKAIKENYPDMQVKESNLKNWAVTFRLMIDRDNRTEQAIRNCIDWVSGHDFWHKNILSADKLRKQYDRLVMEAKDQAKFGVINGGKNNEDHRSSYPKRDFSKYKFR